MLHYARYYLEILLSMPETWEQVRGIHHKDGDMAVFVAFWNYKKFTKLYMDVVARTTYGAGAPETVEAELP